MILPDHRIRAYIEALGLGIEPYDPDAVQPASLDVRMGPTFRRFRDHGRRIELRAIPDDLTYEVDGSDGFVLGPGEFALGATAESVRIPNNLVAVLDGRSTIGRLGMTCHVTAGFIDPGFQGHVTTELNNVGPYELVIHPGDPAGQLVFYQLTSPCLHPYGSDGLHSKYQGQAGPVGPRPLAEIDKEAAA